VYFWHELSAIATSPWLGLCGGVEQTWGSYTTVETGLFLFALRRTNNLDEGMGVPANLWSYFHLPKLGKKDNFYYFLMGCKKSISGIVLKNWSHYNLQKVSHNSKYLILKVFFGMKITPINNPRAKLLFKTSSGCLNRWSIPHVKI
jgi:hypothetical protein